MRKKRYADRDLVRKHEDKKHLGRPNIKRILIFTLLLKKDDAEAWTDLYGSEYGKMVGCCEHGIEPPASTTAGNFLTSFLRSTLLHEVSQSVSQSAVQSSIRTRNGHILSCPHVLWPSAPYRITRRINLRKLQLAVSRRS